MASTEYTIYRNQTFNLAKTLIIKLDEVSAALNQDLEVTGYPLVDRELQDQLPYVPIEAFYKYYQNIAGEYHISDQIKLEKQFGYPLMTVTLVGDQGPMTVDFTKKLLVSDPAVANEYRYGSYYYKELVERYPEFESLILGILYPVKLELAIGAKNGEILYCGGYKKDYVDEDKTIGYVRADFMVANGVIEDQEINFIPKLQTWIDKYLFRWSNREYALTDDLYVAASLSVMYLQMVGVMMNIRLENCHTPYVHSFHIRQYLDSHGELGHVIAHLPMQSLLWLYRNLQYCEANTGKQSVFEDIITHIFTPAFIPISGYDTTHNVGLMPEQLLPSARVVKQVLNFEPAVASSAMKSIEAMLLAGVNSARNNESELPYAQERIEEAIAYSNDDTMRTKVVESEMLSLPGKYPFSLTDTLLNLWLYTAEELDVKNKSLQGTVFVTNPLTGNRMAMTLSNAYKVALYCFNKGISGNELLAPPSFDTLMARMIPRSNQYVPTSSHLPFPTLSAMSRIAHLIPAAELSKLYRYQSWDLHIQSAEQLNEVGTAVFLQLVDQYNAATQIEDYGARAQSELVINRQYWAKIPCKVTVSDPYPIWLEKIGVMIAGLEGQNLIDLGLELVTAATGLDLNLSRQREASQQAALSVLKHFMSYTVQVVDKISYDQGIPTNTKLMRLSRRASRIRRTRAGGMYLGVRAQLRAKMRGGAIYAKFGQGTIVKAEEQQVIRFKINPQQTRFSMSAPTFRQELAVATAQVMRASIDIPQYYTEDIPPTPVTEVKDLAYYKSDTYPDPKL